MAESSLTTKTLTGAKWSTVSRVGQQLSSVLAMALLARLLDAKAYGLVGMATLFTAFVECVKDLGTTYAIIQRKELDQEFLSSVFWINVLLGVGSAAILFAIAVPVSHFFHEPQVVNILRALAISFPITSASIIHPALLTREMAFKRISISELASAGVGYTAAIVVAFHGGGVWSLVTNSLTFAILSSVLYWVVCPWRPSFRFRWAHVQSIASYSMNLSGFTIVNYAARNADNMIIGRYLGATQLGYYQLAYNLMLYPVQGITGVLGRVLFPAFARIQEDRPRLQAAYLRALTSIAAMAFPIMLGLMVTSAPFIRVFLGSKWGPVVPLFMILAPVGLVQSIVSPAGQLFMATGRSDWFFRWGLFASTIIVTSFFIGVRWGAIGVATAYAITTLVLLYPSLSIPFSLIDLSLVRCLKSIGPILGIALSMAGIALLWRIAIEQVTTQPVVILATTSMVGALAYFVMILRVNPPEISEMLDFLRESRFPIVKRIARLASGAR